MDCDDIAMLLAGESRTLSSEEDAQLRDHVAGCATCRMLAGQEQADQLRPVMRLSEHALSHDGIVLPVVDPIVFAGGKELAHGGMGRVLRARDRRLGREVALKEVLDHGMRARFEREVAITAKLQHPAIVPVYEAGLWPDGTAFYAMRLVTGGTLGDAITKAGTLAARLALLPHVLALADALAYAHARGIVHRDLKPGNVLVGEFGETLVIDWGLAKELGTPDEAPGAAPLPRASELTIAGAVMGTPGFMAPEQAAGEPVDERADVYALGAILYSLLAGYPPHWNPKQTAAEVIAATLRGPATPIAELAPDAPADLLAITERAIAHDRGARFRTAQELAEELRRFQAGQLLRSRQYGIRELVVRWIRRHRAIVAVAASATVIVAVLAITAVVGISRSRAAERTARERAEHALAESQLEQGRQILVAGNPDGAAPLLAAAATALPENPIAQRLVAIAQRDSHRRLARFDGTCAAFRPDGRELAIGRGDGSIIIADGETGAQLRTLPVHGQAIAHLAYAADGAHLLVAAASGVTLRDARSGAITTTLATAPATDAKFVAGGRMLVLGDGEVRLYTPEGAPLGSFALVGAHLIAVSRDGASFAAVGDAAITVASTRDLAPLAVLPVTGGYVYDAAFSAAGELIAGRQDATRRWSLAPPTELARLPPADSLAWLDDTTLFAGGHVIDLRDGSDRSIARDIPLQAVAALDRGHGVTGGYDRMIRIWDVARPALPVASLATAAATSELVVGPGGRRMVSTAFGGGPAELWDVTQLPAPTPLATVGGRIEAMIGDRAGRVLVRWHGAAATGASLFAPGHEQVATLSGWPLAFRPHGDEVVTDDDGRLLVASARDGHQLRVVTGPERLYHLAYSTSGARVATSSDRHVDIRDATTWQILTGFDAGTDIRALALDEADHLVTGHESGAVRIWNARTGALLRQLDGHAAHVSALEIRGGLLASDSWDKTRRIWSMPGGEPVATLSTNASDVALSPDGLLLAIADGSAAITLVDAAQGRVLERLPVSDPTAAIVFVDASHVAVGGTSGRIELVDLAIR